MDASPAAGDKRVGGEDGEHKRAKSRVRFPEVPTGDFDALSSAMSPDPVTPPKTSIVPGVAGGFGEALQHAMTPPQAGRQARARSDPRSGDPVSPGSNCGTEELRIFSQKKFNHLENLINHLTGVQFKQQQVVDNLLQLRANGVQCCNEISDQQIKEAGGSPRRPWTRP